MRAYLGRLRAAVKAKSERDPIEVLIDGLMLTMVSSIALVFVAAGLSIAVYLAVDAVRRVWSAL